MVAVANCQFPIRLESLALAHVKFVSYEPELFPGLVYRLLNPKITLLVFVRYVPIFFSFRLQCIYKCVCVCLCGYFCILLCICGCVHLQLLLILTSPPPPPPPPIYTYPSIKNSGKVVITGAKTQNDLREGFDRLYYILLEHRKEVLSSIPRDTTSSSTSSRLTNR
jgi:hypothetical protein